MSKKDPYKDIIFNKRQAQILDKDGEPIYQNQVVFPDYYSDNAVNIISSKYFHNEENDIRHLIDRVSDTLTEWSKEQNYFETVNQIDGFNYNLKNYQIQQLFAFNSPVYFNVGTTDQVQASACFIIDIKDDMESIAQVGVVESKIFKKGSGSGMNISPLRSKFENVSKSKGFASGCVSFLKVHDTLACVIRSGGSLRRSAKLVCLNIDHPDIEEFIDCKKFEEEKIKALQHYGIKARKGAELSDEVFFQNTNLSVRIPDNFMEKVLKNEEWETKYVTNGKTHKSYKARDLLYRIAERAWDCADPGLQFHDHVNKWNTCKNDGEINSSNPCLPKWAPILTPSGYKRFGNIKNKILFEGQKDCSDVIKTANSKKVFELELKNGMCLYATEDHRVLTDRGDICIKDLKVNDLVKVSYERVTCENNQEEYEKGFIAGYLYSEGSIYYSKNRILINFSLGIEEFGLENDLISLLKKYIIDLDKDFIPHHQKPNTCLVLKINKKSSINSVIDIFGARSKEEFDLFDHSLSYQKGFIDSFITFDGHVIDYRYNKVIRATQAGDRGLDLLKDIQLSLASFGIYSNLCISNHEKSVKRNNKVYYHQTVYNLLINDVWEFNKEFKIYSPIKNKVMQQIVEIPKKHPTRLSNIKEYQFIKGIREYSEEDVYDINVPDGNHFVSSGVVVHNCGEFLWLDNSACNLASINLLKFINYNNETYSYDFDIDLFKSVIETVVTAQDAIIEKSVYPTEKITENSVKYRPIGLGYTNLGALLMYLGLPYDSDEGRNIASNITALMTGVALISSHKLALRKNPFERFENNKEQYYNVLKEHHKALKKTLQSTHDKFSQKLGELNKEIWSKIDELIKLEKPFRNSQVTLLAPTGTISLAMDAQTTGVEPEFSHVKFKRLSNTDGGVITFVNPLTKICLKNLGYEIDEIETIECFIKENKSLSECKLLDHMDRRVFDTSVNLHKDQIISYEGHLKMLAAVQPFISGGISKTVNLPNNATVEDIFKCYLESWRLGLKGVTIYRDGSKNYQPLSSSNEIKETELDEIIEEAVSFEDLKHDDRLIKHLHAMLAERKLPPERPAIIYKFNVGGVKGFLTCGLYEDGELGEIFINISKEGSTLSGLLDCLATVVSISLQKGVPLKDIVEKMMWQKFEPYGFTTDKDIRTATSIVDFIFKYLGVKFLSHKEKIELGLIKEEDNKYIIEEEVFEENDDISPGFKNSNNSMHNMFAGPSCNNCGSIMIKKGNCFLCMNCGNNNGACG